MHDPAKDRCWFLVPARGGSRGVPRKNVLRLGNKPLIAHVLDTLSAAWPRERVIVMTDDDEVASIAGRAGVRIFREERTTGKATLDHVALEACRRLTEEGASAEDILVTVQPTSPFTSGESIAKCIARFEDGFGTVLTVTDDRHLRWTRDADGRPVPAYEARVNRQEQKPVFRETGGVIAARIGEILRTGTRIQQGRVAIVEVDEREAIDIDTYADFVVAEHFASRRRAIIRADGSREMGLGHVARALALAAQLLEFQLTIVTRDDGGHALGHGFLAQHAYPLRAVGSEAAFLALVEEVKPDVVFLDVLNTDPGMMAALRKSAKKIVTFEDLGEGAKAADLVVNDLYVTADPSVRALCGVENALLSTVFDHVAPNRTVRDTVERLLVVFGGTDPANLTEKALGAIGAMRFGGEVTVVLGPGRRDRPVALESYDLKGQVLNGITDMAQVMSRADLAISSAGRTVTELMCLGVPTLVLCQNSRELLHTHASMPFGVMNMGLGALVSEDSLARTLEYLIKDREIRARMNALMLRATANRDNRSIVRRILNHLGMD